MSFLDRLFGRKEEPEDRELRADPPRPAAGQREFRGQSGQLSDEQAIQRYRYLLRTAPPEVIE